MYKYLATFGAGRPAIVEFEVLCETPFAYKVGEKNYIYSFAYIGKNISKTPEIFDTLEEAVDYCVSIVSSVLLQRRSPVLENDVKNLIGLKNA